MTEYEKAARSCGLGDDAETVVSGWSLVYYFRDEHRLCDPIPVTNLWHRAGVPYREQVIQDRAEGRLGLQPLGSMTKPASR